jgi:hypothetical protein
MRPNEISVATEDHRRQSRSLLSEMFLELISIDLGISKSELRTMQILDFIMSKEVELVLGYENPEERGANVPMCQCANVPMAVAFQ